MNENEPLVWVHKSTWMNKIIPVLFCDEYTRNSKKVKIKLFRRMEREMGIEIKTIDRKNVYTLTDFISIRKDVHQRENESQNKYNRRLVIALEAAKLKGVISHV